MEIQKVDAANYPTLKPGEHYTHQYSSGRHCGIGCNAKGEILKTGTYKNQSSAKRAIKQAIAQ